MLNRNLSDFIAHLTMERGLAPNSVRSYSTDLNDFLAYMQDTRQINSAAGVKRDHILDYLTMLQEERQDAPATLARRLVALKLFFRYLTEEEVVTENVTELMDSPRLWRLLPDYLSEEEVENFLAIFRNVEEWTPLALRNLTMMELLYSSGLRVSELADLEVSALNADRKSVV